MSKLTTKAEIINAAKINYKKLWELIDSLKVSPQNVQFDFDLSDTDGAYHWGRDKNLRDVLTHLYEWHRLVLEWVKNNESGKAAAFLPAGITWANYQKMNVDFFEKHQNTAYEAAKEMLDGSHGDMLNLMEKYSENELFAKFPFNLKAKSSIAEYCRSATASHYDWAIKKLKAHTKALQ